MEVQLEVFCEPQLRYSWRFFVSLNGGIVGGFL